MYAIINEETGDAYTITDAPGISNVLGVSIHTIKYWFRNDKNYKYQPPYHIAKVVKHIKSNRRNSSGSIG